MERARILIVDDHVEIITGLRALIETDENTEVVGQATSAEQAVEQARALKPDVVVMDFSMGDMDGIEAASAIRKDNPETEVVILSVYESEEHAQRAASAGVRTWIPKSLPPHVLLQELHDVSTELQGRRNR